MDDYQRKEREDASFTLDLEIDEADMCVRRKKSTKRIEDSNLTVIVGLGGCGGLVLRELFLKEFAREDVVAGYIDYDRYELGESAEDVTFVPLTFNKSYEDLGAAYPQLEMEKRIPCTPSMLRGAVGEMKTRATTAFVFDAAELSGRLVPLEEKIEDAFYRRDTRCARVVLINSLAGATGSGLFLKVALYLREFFKKRGWSVTVEGAFLLPSIYTEMSVYAHNFRINDCMNANAFAALSELERFNAEGLRRAEDLGVDPLLKKRLRDLSEGERVIDRVWLFDNKKKNGSRISNHSELICGMAGALYARYLSSTRMQLESMLDGALFYRIAGDDQNSYGLYGFLGFGELKYPADVLKKYCAVKSTMDLIAPAPDEERARIDAHEAMKMLLTDQIERLKSEAEANWKTMPHRRAFESGTFSSAEAIDAFWCLAEDVRHGIDYCESCTENAKDEMRATLTVRKKESIPHFLEGLFFEKTVTEQRADGTYRRIVPSLLFQAEESGELRVLPLWEVRARAQALGALCRELLSDRYSDGCLEEKRASLRQGRELMNVCPLHNDLERMHERFLEKECEGYLPFQLIEGLAPLRIVLQKGKIKEWYDECRIRQTRELRSYGTDLITRRFLEITEELSGRLLKRLDELVDQARPYLERGVKEIASYGSAPSQNAFVRVVGTDPALLEAEYLRLCNEGRVVGQESKRRFYKELCKLLLDTCPSEEIGSCEYKALLRAQMQFVLQSLEKEELLLPEEDVLIAFCAEQDPEKDVYRAGRDYAAGVYDMEIFRLIDRLNDMASEMGTYGNRPLFSKTFCGYCDRAHDALRARTLIGTRLPAACIDSNESKGVYFLSVSCGLDFSCLPDFDEAEGRCALAYDRVMDEMEVSLNDGGERAFMLSPHLDKRFK